VRREVQSPPHSASRITSRVRVFSPLQSSEQDDQLDQSDTSQSMGGLQASSSSKSGQGSPPQAGSTKIDRVRVFLPLQG
jgi:hypothetical protein